MKCTSNPSNKLIKKIMSIIFDNSLKDSFNIIKELIKKIFNLIGEIAIMDNDLDKKCKLLIDLAKIENNIVFSKDVQIDIQLGGLISILQQK